jgi:hypothetical protein
LAPGQTITIRNRSGTAARNGIDPQHHEHRRASSSATYYRLRLIASTAQSNLAAGIQNGEPSVWVVVQVGTLSLPIVYSQRVGLSLSPPGYPNLHIQSSTVKLHLDHFRLTLQDVSLREPVQLPAQIRYLSHSRPFFRRTTSPAILVASEMLPDEILELGFALRGFSHANSSDRRHLTSSAVFGAIGPGCPAEEWGRPVAGQDPVQVRCRFVCGVVMG